ncbi:peptidoglycan DD-metalloendopeptidase family protein [Clostridium sp. LY3-2]|uniref:peptidoglycan DD-metalloendopeptidase family protein n=1 Tax=Clostridium sp. LY3-2 TaxID=2942482 RepID=UPI00215235FB|nr:peptidoglycan DD-metalloendopeptidase family protein [Clostridium sp. LY3-2]MCR6516187.1 peptidoglycan DD-metalloendopeptidase family protein [Clostridium sp. LY3-2]
MVSDDSRKKLFLLLVLLNLIVLSGISYYNEKSKIVEKNNIVLGSSLFGRGGVFGYFGNSINKGELVGVYIEGKLYGYVSNKAEGEKVLENVVLSYMNDMGLKNEDLEGVNIKGSVEYKKELTDIKDIKTIESVAEAIKREDALCVDLIVKDTRDVVIEPKLEVKNTKDLVLGKQKVLEGTEGLKTQELKVTYRNGKEYEADVLSENIIALGQNKVIYKGTGDPIAMGIAFLKEPTKDGVLTSEFGSRWGRMHNGIDIGNELGKPVYSAFDGKVKKVFYEQYGYGNAVIIEHSDGLETRYAHLNNYNVKEGDTVKKGEKIGEVGNTGRSTGPHLHFELRKNDNPVNPLKYIEQTTLTVYSN